MKKWISQMTIEKLFNLMFKVITSTMVILIIVSLAYAKFNMAFLGNIIIESVITGWLISNHINSSNAWKTEEKKQPRQ